MQLVHTLSAVTVQPAALLDVPAGQTVQAAQAVALAADQLTPAVHAVHLVFAVAVQVDERYVPAVQALEEQLEHGA